MPAVLRQGGTGSSTAPLPLCRRAVETRGGLQRALAGSRAGGNAPRARGCMRLARLMKPLSPRLLLSFPLGQLHAVGRGRCVTPATCRSWESAGKRASHWCRGEYACIWIILLILVPEVFRGTTSNSGACVRQRVDVYYVRQWLLVERLAPTTRKKGRCGVVERFRGKLLLRGRGRV